MNFLAPSPTPKNKRDLSVQNDTTAVRTARLEVRLSVQERERLEQRAQAFGLSLSDYVRSAALGFLGVEQREPAAAQLAAKLTPPVFTAPTFKCPVQPACDYRASSSAARCPTHGRRVVPA